MVNRLAAYAGVLGVALGAPGCGWVLQPPLSDQDGGVIPADVAGDRQDPGWDAPPMGDAGTGGACTGGPPRSCYDGAPGTAGVGACHVGSQTCSAAGRWGPCTGEVIPSREVCNGADDDCNGTVDDGLSRVCFDASPAYVRTASPAPWVEVCSAPGHMLLMANTDDAVSTLTLPFPFTYFGTARTEVAVSSNGIVSFDSGSPVYVNTPLPDSRLPDTVFAFFDDLYLRAGVCTATVGTAPARQFVVEWTDAFFYPNNALATHLTFEVVLSELGGTIDVVYRQMVGEGDRGTGLSATIGVGSAVGGLYDQAAFNTAGAARGGTGYRWTPAASRPVGVCVSGSQTCRAAMWGTCMAEVTAGPEVCDALDNDCDGVVDDGVIIGCYTGAPGTQDVGACHAGARTCHTGTYGPCTGEVDPIPEICGNGIDDDCNNVVDNGC